MATIIQNKFMKAAQDIPEWARDGRISTRTVNLWTLVEALRAVGNTRAIIMTEEEFRLEFPAKYAVAAIKNFGKKHGMHIKVVRHDAKIAITATTFNKK